MNNRTLDRLERIVKDMIAERAAGEKTELTPKERTYAARVHKMMQAWYTAFGETCPASLEDLEDWLLYPNQPGRWRRKPRYTPRPYQTD